MKKAITFLARIIKECVVASITSSFVVTSMSVEHDINVKDNHGSPRVDARPNVADLMNAVLAAASSTSRDVKFIRGLMSGR